MAQARRMVAVRHLQLQHHDGDDDGDHAIAERFEPAFGHCCFVPDMLLEIVRAHEVWVPQNAINAIKWTRLSCCSFAVAPWSLTSLREKLVKIGAEVVRHARYDVFQMAEVAVPKELFEQIL